MRSNTRPIQHCRLSDGRERRRQKPSSPALIRPVSAVPLEHIKPNPRNPRTHSKKQIRQIADCIQAIGFAAPVLIDETGVLLAGHGRLEAAKLLGLKRIPAVVIEGLSEARKRALLLADNRIAQSAGWDRERLADELTSLPELLVEDGLDISVTGFEPAEIDALLADFENDASDPADDIDPAFLSAPVVTRQGDLWRLGKHRLLCATRAKYSTSPDSWAANAHIWRFLIRLIMCAYAASSAVAKSSTKNSPWPPARWPRL